MKRFARDRSGAVMVMATFFAIFLVAIVYHVAGVGGACLEQQIMQDAADATVFSAATTNARGMNLIALINLIMAAILAILVALRLVQALLTVATAVFVALCAIPWTSAVGCPFVTPLTNLTNELNDAADAVEEVVNEVIPALRQTEDIVNQAVPILAEVEAINVSQSYDAPVRWGFVWPVTEELPTQGGDFETLCAKAGDNVVELAFFFLPEEGREAMVKYVGPLIEALVTTFQDFFCGGDDNEENRPDSTKRVARSYPAEIRDRCKTDTEAEDDDTQEENPPFAVYHSAECRKKNRAVGESAPACDCGDCDGEEERCARCRECSEAGCDYCIERMRDGSYKRGLWTVRRDRWLERYDSELGSWRFDSWLLEDERWTQTHKGDPCRNAAWKAAMPCQSARPASPRVSYEIEPGGDRPAPMPAVCFREKETYTTMVSREMERVSWLYLHSCEINEEVPVVAEGTPIDGNDKAPRVFDAEAYDTVAKMRAVVVGRAASGRRLEAVGIATQRRRRGVSRRFSVAAATYGSPDMDLWHMNWRARLIRFRLSYDSETEGEGGDAEESGSWGGTGGGGDGWGGGMGGGGWGGGDFGGMPGLGGGLFEGCTEGKEEVCDDIRNSVFGDDTSCQGMFEGGSVGGFDLEDLILH